MLIQPQLPSSGLSGLQLPGQYPLCPPPHNAGLPGTAPLGVQTHGPMAARAAAPVLHGSSLSRKSAFLRGNHLGEPCWAAEREHRGGCSASPCHLCSLRLYLVAALWRDLPHPVYHGHPCPRSLTILPAPRCPGGYHVTGWPVCCGLCRASCCCCGRVVPRHPCHGSKITRKPLQSLTSDLTCRQRSCGPDLQPGL